MFWKEAIVPENRIDTLRNMISAIGRKQIEYHGFFPNFAEKIAAELGRYLGEENSVALTTDEIDFQFDTQYRHEGVKLISGRYQIPIMIKFDNLNDSGVLLQRIWLFGTKEDMKVSVSINDERSIIIKENELELLCQEIYGFLCDSFSKEKWFEENSSDYQATNIGFLS